ncbi:PPOX class F420-dependent oxidoreductase [Actinobacteria bacterium YIM 96077]|uniref:PPOX class F420-dependent oxidoreductase n=1 Tax=Phytoactinopolyspora halophila TaxID=1981511 RepID=A0A329R5M3_9ACTN|nr:PPOX class F420-dependent oxidoreductase [Phytoactinopolyspora halophila]AYY12034.1 PPOX class F420-dependent oxidoreductase [Actinobacteria bacterium YIM 96077]RAW18732.1 PPOX class F420-dependent oxidoreductase [Phytoactinopolyspora halophila]
MGVFTELELDYLRGERRLARLATVGADGMPHVAPVGWSLSDDASIIEIGGMDFARTKKFRDVTRTGKAALVVDDVLPPWQPRGVEIRGDAEAVTGDQARIRLHPRRIITWGLVEGEGIGVHHARNVA